MVCFRSTLKLLLLYHTSPVKGAKGVTLSSRSRQKNAPLHFLSLRKEKFTDLFQSEFIGALDFRMIYCTPGDLKNLGKLIMWLVKRCILK